MVSAGGACTLCGLELPAQVVLHPALGPEKPFCCDGCALVYDVAARAGRLDEVLASPPGRRPALGGLLTKGETVFFVLGGMWCSGCTVAAQRILEHQPGVIAAEVSFAAERGRLRYDPAKADPEAALMSLEGLGYRPSLVADPSEERADRHWDWLVVQFLIAMGFGMKVMMFYLNQLYHFYAAGQFGAQGTGNLEYLCWLLATPVLFPGGISILRGAVRALRARTATMDTLVALGVCSAYGYSAYMTLTGRGETYFDSVSMIVTFVLLGRMLEASGASRARKDIRKLLRLQPARARRRQGGAWAEVPARQLAAGDTILVSPGERVPADAEIVEGHGAADEALLTGESAPVSKGVGDTIFAGTLLSEAALTCRVTRPPRETRLAQITQLVEETLAAKPPIQRQADRASAYLALAVLAVAALTALGWWATNHTAARALLAAVAVLVVACPCALGLATPLAVTIALGRAASRGILVRNPVALETAARIGRIVLDKTGTLTRGRMAVVATQTEPGLPLSPGDLLGLAAAVEQYSEHPVAKAIAAACTGTPAAASEFRAVRGMGASAVVAAPSPSPHAPPAGGAQPSPFQGEGVSLRVLVGSLRFVGAEAHPVLLAEAEARAGRGETVVWVGWRGQVAGLVALRDEPNTSATGALRQLAELGIKAVMLSGDNPRTAAAIATELGLAEREGHCSPADKALRIQAWQKAGEAVAMVGDGINDAPALAQASLSITVAGGTDVAGTVSDVILTSHDLALLPDLIRLSRRTRQIIRLNLGWALAYNLVTVPLAVVGLISPAVAAATMAASSVLVVANSLRLRAGG